MRSEKYIEKLYQQKTGFILYEEGEKESLEKNMIFPLYGEMLYSAVNKIMDALYIKESDIFYDLGSGVGKIPLQFFLESNLKKSCGIEGVFKRHQFAEEVYTEVKISHPELFKNRELISINSNFLLSSWQEVTILMISIFDNVLLSELEKKLIDCKGLRYIISYRPLNNPLAKVNTLEIDCSFGKHVSYIYSN